MTETKRSKRIILDSADQTRSLEEAIRGSAASACIALSELMSEREPLEVLQAIKFQELGFDSLDGATRVNLMEQIHQTFRHIVSLRGVEYLLERHPGHAPYSLSLGGGAGHDIESTDGRVVAETVALVTPVNNNKLRHDIERIRASAAEKRYVFYLAAEGAGTVSDPEVDIVAIEM